MSGSASVEEWSGKDRTDENFPVGSFLIRRNLRAHVHAFYSFARNADDIADSPTLTPEDKLARLDVMQEVLLGQRAVGSASARTLRASLEATGVTARHSTDLLVAFRQDATKRRYANWDELFDYCRYSAMPVGRHVLDLHHESAETHAPSDALCASLQILNHLQDCAKDFSELDRCYLPMDLLNLFGAGVADVRGAAATPGLRHVIDTLLNRVDRLNQEAANFPPRIRDRRLRLEVATIVGLARRLAELLRQRDPVAKRVKLRKIDGVLSLLAALRFFR